MRPTAQAANARGQALARSGKTEEALAEFDKAIALDPHNAEALYNRGLLYQGERQHQLAIEDFTAANGLMPQQAEPLVGRAISYLAIDKFKEAAADLDEAVQADPQNAQAWTTRGLAYERLGDKDTAKTSYGRAINLRPRDEAARSGLARVGGKPPATALFRQHRVKYRLRRQQHVLGDEVRSLPGGQLPRTLRSSGAQGISAGGVGRRGSSSARPCRRKAASATNRPANPTPRRPVWRP